MSNTDDFINKASTMVDDVLLRIECLSENSDFDLVKKTLELKELLLEISKSKKKNEWYYVFLLKEEKELIYLLNEMNDHKDFLKKIDALKSKLEEVNSLVLSKEILIKDLSEKNKKIKAFLDNNIGKYLKPNDEKYNLIRQNFVWYGLRIKELKKSISESKEAILKVNFQISQEEYRKDCLNKLTSRIDNHRKINANLNHYKSIGKIKFWVFLLALRNR